MRLPALQLTPHGRYLIPHQPTDGTRAQRDADAGYDVQQVLEFLGRPTSNVARDASVCASKRRRTGGGWTIDLADTLLLAGRNQQRGLEFRFLLGIAAPYLVTGQSSEPEQVPEEFKAATSLTSMRTPRLDLVDVQQGAPRRKQIFDMLLRLIAPSRNRENLARGLADVFRGDEALLAQVVMESSSALRTHLCHELTAGADLARHIMCSQIVRMVSHRRYLKLRKLEATLEVKFQGFEGIFALPARRASQEAADNLPALPAFDVTVEDEGRSVGLTFKLDDLLKAILRYPSVREVARGRCLVLKMCGDAARLIKKENITVSSLVIVFPGCGGSVKSVVVTGAYVGDDHHRQLRAHLHLGLFADLKRLAAEGLRDVPEAIHDYGVPVEYYFVVDGAFERDVVGDTSAAGLQPISGLHVHKDDLGQRLFRFWQEEDQAEDRLEAAVLLEDASAKKRAEFAAGHGGVRGLSLLGIDGKGLVKLDVMHGVFNIWKHYLGPAFSVMLETDSFQGFEDALRKAGVHFKVYEKPFKSFSIQNGAYYDRLQDDDVWRSAFEKMRTNGFECEAAVLTYIGLLISRIVRLLMDRRSGCTIWLQYFVDVEVLGAALLIAFGDDAIKPSPFGMICKLPDYIAWIKDIEVMLGLEEGSLSILDMFHNGQYEQRHISFSREMLDGRRGGGRDAAATAGLGLLANVITDIGNTTTAQYIQLYDALLGDMHRFALDQILDGGMGANVQERLQRYASRYGAFREKHAKSSKDSLEDWLSLSGPPPAPAQAPRDDDDADVPEAIEGDDSASASGDEEDHAGDEDPPWMTVEPLAPQTAADDAAAAATRAPTKQAKSGVLAECVVGATALKIVTTGDAPREVVVNKHGVRIYIQLEGDELGVSVFWPWNAIEAIDHAPGAKVLHLTACVAAGRPIVARQHKEPGKKAGDPPKLKWGTAASSDPTPNKIATSKVSWTLRVKMPTGWAHVYEWLQKYAKTGPSTRITFAAGRSNLNEYDALDAAQDAVEDTTPRGLPPDVVPLLAFPIQCQESVLELEQMRHRWQNLLPRDVFDEDMSLRFRSAVLKDLDEFVFTTVPSRFSDEIPAVFGAD